MSLNLRKRTRFNYYEPEEPNFDEYIYCELCSDFVYDYCSIHGPLLVIPDNKVPVKTSFPPFVPRAALTIPHEFLHLARSGIPGAGLGVFATLTLPRGVRFGPYRGQRTQNADSAYCWQIYSSNNKRSHIIDAVDGDRANWMRFVNCSRHWKEQNLLAYQYKGQLYYRTIKIIPPYTELMVFYGSEFANALHINLSKYNSPTYYREIISTSTSKEKKDYETQEEYLLADHFKFIDEISVTDNNKNSFDVNQINNNLSTENENSLIDTTGKEKSVLETLYECNICSKTYKHKKSLKVHALEHRDVWKFNCNFCRFRTNKQYCFKRHIGKHTNTYQFSCKTCLYKTNYKRNFIKHCFRHENAVTKMQNGGFAAKTCTLCDFRTNSRRIFQSHMSEHSGIVYKCGNCSYSSYSKYNLCRHIKRSHSF